MLQLHDRPTWKTDISYVIVFNKVVPGRMSLLIIMLLVVINLFTNQEKMRGSATRHDKYLLICVSFIVAAVVEYGLILAIQELDK